MKILFITSTRLGDAVLSTGALDHFIRTGPDAEITVACGPLVAGLFEQAPNIKRVIALKKEPFGLHWYKLWMETTGASWDIVVDLRNSLLSRLVDSKKKYIWSSQDNKRHKVEQIADVIGISPPPVPTLWFNAETLKKAEELIPSGGPVLAIGPAANWPAKVWPAKNFNELIRRLTAPGSILPGMLRVAVFAAPGEENMAREVLDAVPASRHINVIAKASPVVVAAALKRCNLYIGNDSGLMHSAAAVGTPTLGLFGPSWPHLYRPWGDHCAYVSTPKNFDELTKYPGYHRDTTDCLMTTLTVDAAEKAAVSLWKKINR